MKRAITYLRVSTKGQGESGLGLEGQRATCEAYLRTNGVTLLWEYVEIESGKRADRPELTRALAHARRGKAILVVAKLDRLARNVAFLSRIMESGVEFVAVDNPHANRLTIHILAAVAEDEARRISERTKAALAAYKARGGKLGAARRESRNLTAEARRRGTLRAAEARKAAAREAYADLAGEIRALRDGGATLEAIAQVLNERGYATRRGRPWNPVQVLRVLRSA